MRVRGVLLLVSFAFTSVLCQRREIRLSPGQEVAIEIPGAPDHIPAHLNIEWNLSSPPSTQILLFCKDLALYKFNGICDDYAFYIDGTEEANEVLCGTYRPFTKTSVGNMMKLTLRIGEIPNGRLQCTVKVIEPQETTTQLTTEESIPETEMYHSHLKIDDNALLIERMDSPPSEKARWTIKTEPHLRIGITCDDVRYPGGALCEEYKLGLNISDGTTEKTLCQPDSFIGQRGATITIDYDSGRGRTSINCRAVAVKTGEQADYYKELVTMEEDSSEFGVVPGRKRTTCRCGWSNKEDARVIGGTVTTMNEYSFMVDFIYEEFHLCGGSILTEYHVLTAAHCTWQRNVERMQVLAGAQNLENDHEPYRQMHDVAEIIDHEAYNYSEYIYDISILRLKTPIQFNEKIGPVCLPTPSLPNLNNKNVRVIGWGWTEKGRTSELQKALLRVVDPATCLVTNGRNLDPANPSKMCFYSNNRDACRGDSGGPFVWLDPETNRFTQVALVSYGRGCNDTIPSVGSAVPYFVPWIQNVIGGRGCTKID